MKTKFKTAILGIVLFCCYPAGAIMWTEGYHQMVPGEIYGESAIYNDVRLDIYGGDIGYVWAFNTTLTNWYSGEMYYFVSNDNSIVNIYGGKILITLGISDNAVVNLYNSLSINRFSAGQNGILNLYAYNIFHQTYGGHFNDGWIEGKYISNNQPFHIDMIGDSFSHINIVPEPSTLFLLGIGCLFLRHI